MNEERRYRCLMGIRFWVTAARMHFRKGDVAQAIRKIQQAHEEFEHHQRRAEHEASVC